MADITDPFCQFDSNGVFLGGSWSVGSACVTLEPGEVVSLETLIRGMMYPSGNDAAWAIAYYVAQAYGEDTNGDTIVDGHDFVERMNQHAIDIGLTDTHFTSANGWDDPGSANPDPGTSTTTRPRASSARSIDHGLEAHPHFGEVIGFLGTYTDTSQGPNGTKTHTPADLGAPRLSGLGGRAREAARRTATACTNGSAWRASAKRIGRRVVARVHAGRRGTGEARHVRLRVRPDLPSGPARFQLDHGKRPAVRRPL